MATRSWSLDAVNQLLSFFFWDSVFLNTEPIHAILPNDNWHNSKADSDFYISCYSSCKEQSISSES